MFYFRRHYVVEVDRYVALMNSGVSLPPWAWQLELSVVWKIQRIPGYFWSWTCIAYARSF